MTEESRRYFKNLTQLMANDEDMQAIMRMRSILEKRHLLVLWYPNVDYVLCSPTEAFPNPKLHNSEKQASILGMLQLAYRKWCQERIQANSKPHGVLFAEVSRHSCLCVACLCVVCLCVAC